MDDFLNKELSSNFVNYKRSLDRIINKYAKLQYHEDQIEVDLENTQTTTIERYMERSKRLSEFMLKGQTELRDETINAHESKMNSQFDLSLYNVGADETCASSVFNMSTSNTAIEEDGDVSAIRMHESWSDMTQVTVSSVDESQSSFSEVELQPEDQDEELQMTLSRHGSLLDIYPSMISRIENAWRRQHISEAADSVLRRYRKWRQPNRNLNVNNTFTVKLKRNKIQTERTTDMENSGSPLKRHFTGTESNTQPYLQSLNNHQERQAHQHSPGKGKGLQRKAQPVPVLVMDFSQPPETVTPNYVCLNETFTVSEPSPPEKLQQEEQTSYHTTPRGHLDLSLRSKRLLNAANSLQADQCSMYTSKTAASREMFDYYTSPIKQSPAKVRLMSSLSRSPQSLPRSDLMESSYREPMRPRSLSLSLSSPQRKGSQPQRMFYPEDSHHSLQSQLPSPSSERAVVSRHSLRRHLSFDSSVPFNILSNSPQKVDEEFIMLYHKFVCQNKSSFLKGPSCRFCARNSEMSRSHSSSSLAALALSPHRSVLRKRHRELSLENHPQSKRFREEYFAKSLGIKRCETEMLRQHHSPSESQQLRDRYPTTPVKAMGFQRFSTQQGPADVYQDAWMRQSRHVSATELSGHKGSSPLRRIADGSSPRRW